VEGAGRRETPVPFCASSLFLTINPLYHHRNPAADRLSKSAVKNHSTTRKNPLRWSGIRGKDHLMTVGTPSGGPESDFEMSSNSRQVMRHFPRSLRESFLIDINPGRSRHHPSPNCIVIITMSSADRKIFHHTVSLFISNMHCPSCVDAIAAILAPLQAVKNLSVSLLQHRITFSVDTSFALSRLKPDLTIDTLVGKVKKTLLDEGGFFVIDEGDDDDLTESWLEKIGWRKDKPAKKFLDKRRQRHVEHCEACQCGSTSWAQKANASPRSSTSTAATLIRTTLFVSGLTYASGAPSIIAPFKGDDRVISVDINLHASSAILVHDPAFTAEEVVRVLQDAGFEATVTSTFPELNVPVKPAEESVARTTLSIKGMTCASCTGSISSILLSYPSVLNVDINLLSSSAVVQHQSALTPSEVKQIIDDTGFDAEVISSVEQSQSRAVKDEKERRRTVVSIEGMTCASCSTSLTNGLKALVGVEEVNIDLLGNRGTIVHADFLSASTLVATIEDLGYGAEVASTDLLSVSLILQDTRTISIRVLGIFCPACPEKINAYLSSLLLISYSPLSIATHKTTVTYRPGPLTIRSILEGLSGVSPGFHADVIKSESLSERGHKIQQREVRLLLWHFGVAFVFAIPTFIM